MKFNIIPASNLTKPQFNIIAIIFFNSSHFSKHTGCPKNVEGRFLTKNLAEKETPRDFILFILWQTGVSKPTKWVVGDDQEDLTKKEKSNYWRYKGFQLFNTCSTRPK